MLSTSTHMNPTVYIPAGLDCIQRLGKQSTNQIMYTVIAVCLKWVTVISGVLPIFSCWIQLTLYLAQLCLADKSITFLHFRGVVIGWTDWYLYSDLLIWQCLR